MIKYQQKKYTCPLWSNHENACLNPALQFDRIFFYDECFPSCLLAVWFHFTFVVQRNRVEGQKKTDAHNNRRTKSKLILLAFLLTTKRVVWIYFSCVYLTLCHILYTVQILCHLTFAICMYVMDHMFWALLFLWPQIRVLCIVWLYTNLLSSHFD